MRHRHPPLGTTPAQSSRLSTHTHLFVWHTNGGEHVVILRHAQRHRALKQHWFQLLTINALCKFQQNGHTSRSTGRLLIRRDVPREVNTVVIRAQQQRRAAAQVHCTGTGTGTGTRRTLRFPDPFRSKPRHWPLLQVALHGLGKDRLAAPYLIHQSDTKLGAHQDFKVSRRFSFRADVASNSFASAVISPYLASSNSGCTVFKNLVMVACTLGTGCRGSAR